MRVINLETKEISVVILSNFKDTGTRNRIKGEFAATMRDLHVYPYDPDGNEEK